jgi:uncharacterized protein
MNYIKIVADTNTLVSALIGSSLRHLLEYRKKGYFKFVFSQSTFHEFISVLNRPRLAKFISQDKKIDFLNGLVLSSITVVPQKNIKICRDVKDDIFLACAIEGKVDYIVSFDQDLLVLNTIENIPIIAPATFLQIMASFKS